uniref:Uncharacterized protein n=1 Tax=Triticum urartu TaxID=4572 RepID=A0A8R7JZK8_TRIUA
MISNQTIRWRNCVLTSRVWVSIRFLRGQQQRPAFVFAEFMNAAAQRQHDDQVQKPHITLHQDKPEPPPERLSS